MRTFDKCALDELINRDWIRRAWTYQEIILASNPVIICGGKFISWSRLQRGLDYLNNPITPFYISFTDLIRASFTYKGPRKIMLPSRSAKIYDDARSLKSFYIWRHMHQIWVTVYRPSCWNWRKLRMIPQDDEEPATPIHSARSYQDELVQLSKTWHYARLIIALANVLVLPAVIVILTALIPIQHYNYMYNPPQPYFYPHSGECNFYFISCDYRLNTLYWSLTTILTISLWIFGLLATVYAVRMAPHPSMVDDGNSKSIVGLVQALRERQATMPADKAFALRGVLDRLKLSTSNHGYIKSYGQVYHNLFLDLLRHDTRLVNLLIDVGPRLPGVPSWVPDWSSLQQRSWLDSRHVHDHADLHGAAFPEPQMKIAYETLGLWSIRKGSVAFCPSMFQQTSGQPSDLSNLDDVARLDQMVGLFAEWVQAISDAASI